MAESCDHDYTKSRRCIPKLYELTRSLVVQKPYMTGATIYGILIQYALGVVALRDTCSIQQSRVLNL